MNEAADLMGEHWQDEMSVLRGEAAGAKAELRVLASAHERLGAERAELAAGHERLGAERAELASAHERLGAERAELAARLVSHQTPLPAQLSRHTIPVWMQEGDSDYAACRRTALDQVLVAVAGA